MSKFPANTHSAIPYRPEFRIGSGQFFINIQDSKVPDLMRPKQLIMEQATNSEGKLQGARISTPTQRLKMRGKNRRTRLYAGPVSETQALPQFASNKHRVDREAERINAELHVRQQQIKSKRLDSDIYYTEGELKKIRRGKGLRKFMKKSKKPQIPVQPTLSLEEIFGAKVATPEASKSHPIVNKVTSITF